MFWWSRVKIYRRINFTERRKVATKMLISLIFNFNLLLGSVASRFFEILLFNSGVKCTLNSLHLEGNGVFHNIKVNFSAFTQTL